MVRASLASEDKKEQLAAAIALGSWPDETMFELLVKFLGTVADPQAHSLVFDACVSFVGNPDRTRSPDITVNYWNLLANAAKSPSEKDKVARARIANKPKPKK